MAASDKEATRVTGARSRPRTLPPDAPRPAPRPARSLGADVWLLPTQWEGVGATIMRAAP
jgi:hypothetical protein